MQVRHTKVSAIADDAAAVAAGEIAPSHWNAAHTITGGLTVLGPFRLNFDSPGQDSTGGPPVTFANSGKVELTELPDDVTILGAIVEVETTFVADPPGSVDINVRVQPHNDPDRSWSILNSFRVSPALDTTAPGVYNANVTFLSGAGVDGTYKSHARTISGAALSASGVFSGGLTAGAVDIFVVITVLAP